MSRSRLAGLVAAAALVAAGAGVAAAAPAKHAKSGVETKTKTAVKTKAKTAVKTKAKTAVKTKAKVARKPAKKSAKKSKATSRTARKGRPKAVRPGAGGDNMPRGWSWPPSKTMIAEGKACTDQLDALGVEWKPAPAEKKVATPITIPSMELGGVKLVSAWRGGPHVMDCHLALGLATYDKELYELGVREMTFLRIYGYTNVRFGGKTKNILSRHALGLAIDVKSFTDADGREVVVETDYPAGDPLLLRIEDFLDDSGGFRTVLTPKNDPVSHHDHFHIEVRVDYEATAKVAAAPKPGAGR